MNEKEKKYLHLSPGQIAWKRFKKHRLAMVSLWVLIILALSSIILPMTSGFKVDQPNIKEIFVPPLSKHIIKNDKNGKEDFIRHILGTDENGRDVFTRLFYGGRISLAVGLLSAIIAAFIGTLIGSISGYFGGLTDSLLMRFTDTMLSLPVLPLLIILSALDYDKITVGELSLGFVKEGWGSILRIITIIALFSWMSVARLVRGEILSLKNREFIDAARVLGSGHKRIILKHLIPNALTPVIISTTLSLGSVIQYEAVLSFLGLGIPATTPSWGNMLSNAREYFIKSPALFIYPGIFIAITVICINFIGDGLRDALDPRQILNKKG